MQEIRNKLKIFLNDNKKEIKRNYKVKNENVTNIKIIIDYQIDTFEDLFNNCNFIESVFFIKFNRNTVKHFALFQLLYLPKKFEQKLENLF